VAMSFSSLPSSGGTARAGIAASRRLRFRLAASHSPLQQRANRVRRQI
jgi:hypothetical protein